MHNNGVNGGHPPTTLTKITPTKKTTNETQCNLNLLYLPEELIDEIMNFLSYNELKNLTQMTFKTFQSIL